MKLRHEINNFFTVYEAPWEIFMIVMAVIYVVIGFIPDWTSLSPSQLRALVILDWTITILFILEFAVRFSAAYSHSGYLKEHWLDLLAVIPLVRWVRVVRIVRVIRVLRLLRLGRIIDSLDDLGVNFARFARLNGLQWALLSLTAVMLIISIVFYFAEYGDNPQVITYWDAFYTSIFTWASAGYGEIAPVTTPGRICGIILAISGVTTWGLLIGNLSAFLTARSSEKIDKQGTGPAAGQLKQRPPRLEDLNKSELQALRGEIDKLLKEITEKSKKEKT